MAEPFVVPFNANYSPPVIAARNDATEAQQQRVDARVEQLLQRAAARRFQALVRGFLVRNSVVHPPE